METDLPCGLVKFGVNLDDLFDLKTDNDEWGKIFYDDPFDSKENKIKVSKLLVDELDSTGSSSFLPHFLECDPVLYGDFSEVDTLTSTITRTTVIQCQDYYPPLSDHELPFHIEIPDSETLLLIAPDYEASRARGFVLRSLELQSFA
ncbi:hypothetical protein Tco_0864397 [Tanacetum coccineum]